MQLNCQSLLHTHSFIRAALLSLRSRVEPEFRYGFFTGNFSHEQHAKISRMHKAFAVEKSVSMFDQESKSTFAFLLAGETTLVSFFKEVHRILRPALCSSHRHGHRIFVSLKKTTFRMIVTYTGKATLASSK